MIVATFPAQLVASPGDVERRTIGGVAMPWGVEGTVRDGTRVRFLPGSLDPAAQPVAVLGHDGPPIGRVAGAADHGDRLEAAVRVSRTQGGDDALVLAADGVLTMFSVGANPTDYRYDDQGVLEVAAADWVHLSLEPVGAFAGATVTTVNATQGAAMPDLVASATATPVEPEPVEPVEPEPVEPVEPGTIQAARAPVAAAPAVVPLRPSSQTPAPTPTGAAALTAAARIIAAGNARTTTGGARAPRIQAALANLTTNDIAGIVRPSYRSEIVGLIDYGMPLVRALQQRPLPPDGMSIDYPAWTTLPTYTEPQSRGLNTVPGDPPVTGEKTEIGTGEAKIDIQSDEIETWAQGADISFQAAQRSNPSFVEAWLRAAAVDAGQKYNAYVGSRLLAVAAPAVAGADFLANVKALFAALAPPKKVPPGPMFLGLSYDVWLDTIDVTEMNGPAFWDMSISFASFLPDENVGGLYSFVDPTLPAGTMLLGSRMGAASYGGPETSADIRVVDVSLLGIDIGVYFFATPAVEYPEAFAKLTGLVTLGAAKVSAAKKA